MTLRIGQDRRSLLGGLELDFSPSSQVLQVSAVEAEAPDRQPLVAAPSA
ncbi:MAG: hypothetical protein P8R54_10870 [Myxococcota bacterium]|nr:hypothetical protein [Myxococcota bacterium]